MRKHDEDQNATNHDNRSLTPRMKQFKNDEMGTTRKGCSHLCFSPRPLLQLPFSEDEIGSSTFPISASQFNEKHFQL